MTAMTAESGTNLVDVPTVGGDVEVRPIPPKLLRAILAKATKDGHIDFNELMVWKLVYGLQDPAFTEQEARSIMRRFSLRTLQPIIDRIDSLSGTDEHLQHGGDELPYRVRKLTEPVVMATAWLERFPVPRGRTPRPATNARTRGSRRTTGSGTTSSGEDSDPHPAKPCPQHGCTNQIGKPTRGPWPDRCADCKRALDAKRKRGARACEKKGHTVWHGACGRCGTYVLKPREMRLPRDAHRYSMPRPATALGPNLDDVGRTSSQREGPGTYVPAELWPGMGSRAPATTAPDLRVEAMRAAVRKGLKVELTRDPARGIVVRIEPRARRAAMDDAEELERAA